jgi:hypothetical protein
VTSGPHKIAHDALGRLLESDGEPAPVVDLATVRGKRGGQP